MNSQTVAFDPLPTINCPSGNITVCGTYSPPPTGGPYTIVSTIELSGNGLLVSGGNQFLTTLTATTFCLTIPTNILNGSTVGNYELLIDFLFVQVNPPFAQFSAASTNGTNPTGADIFYSTTCPIIANDDNTTVNQCSGGSINVITNDLIFGNPATTSNVVVTQLTTSPVVTFNATTGIASIPAGTPPGTYNFTYRICNPVNASQCDPATVSFTVAPQPVVAVNDVRSIAICSSNTTTSVLSNDTVCGTAFSSPVIVSFVGTVSINGATINNLGVITVPSNTASGTYTLSYRVCHANAPTSCSTTATVTLTLTNPPLVVGNDNFTSTVINSITGGLTPSVLTNDTLNGVPVTSSNVTTAIVSSSPIISGLFINSNGVISVPVGQSIGNYTITYSLTQNGCTSNIKTGNVIISITFNEITPDIVFGVRANSTVRSVDTQSNNKIIITGSFRKYNNITCEGIARLNSNLTLDNTTGFNTTGALPIPTGQFGGGRTVPYRMKVLRNASNFDKILLIGGFTGFSGSLSGVGIARLLPDGSPDLTFNNEVLASGVIRGISGSNPNLIRCFYVYPDNAINGNAGKIIIGGMFNAYNGKPSWRFARLSASGVLEESFSNNINTIIAPGQNGTNGFNSSPQAIEVQPDGKIIVGGFFNGFNGVPRVGILRLFNDGTLDTSFNTFLGAINTLWTGTVNVGFVNKIIIEPITDKIIIAGSFSKINNISRNSIARLNTDGTLDITFNPGAGFFPNHITGGDLEPAGMIRDMVIEPAVGNTPYKLYVSGDFTMFDNVLCNEVLRLHCNSTTLQNGTLDNTFGFLNGGPNGFVWSMKKQGSKLIIGGQFTTFNTTSPALNITRILPAPSSGELRGLNIFYDSEPEIDLFVNDEVIIYPNPSNGKINFSTTGFQNRFISIEVTTTLGQKVYIEHDVDSNSNSLDLSSLSKGTYFMSFIDKSKKVTKTIILN